MLNIGKMSSHQFGAVLRFTVPPPKSMRGGVGEMVASWKQSVELPLKFRVFNVCHAWVTRYGHELVTLEDSTFLTNFTSFLEEISKVRSVRRVTSEETACLICFNT